MTTTHETAAPFSEPTTAPLESPSSFFTPQALVGACPDPLNGQAPFLSHTDLLPEWISPDGFSGRAGMHEIASYRSELLRIVMCRISDRMAAEDLVHDTLLKALELRAHAPTPDKLFFWLLTILRFKRSRVTRAHQLRYKHFDDYVEPEELENMPAPDAEGSSDSLCTQLDVLLMLQSIDNPRDRQLMKLRLLGYTFAEIGTVMHITTGNARLRFFRLAGKLRRIFRDGE